VGLPALRLTASAAGRRRNLRGIHIRVLEAGEVAVGDAIVVEARA
jgi:MOSC domain-containing protein YiiM